MYIYTYFGPLTSKDLNAVSKYRDTSTHIYIYVVVASGSYKVMCQSLALNSNDGAGPATARAQASHYYGTTKSSYDHNLTPSARCDENSR